MRSSARGARGQSGLTLMEVLATLVVIIIGLMGIMKVASVAVHSNQRGYRMSLAADKAQARLEALKTMPTSTLACLTTSQPSSCVSSCMSGGGDRTACELALGVTQADPASGIPYADNSDSINTRYTYAYLVNAVSSNIFDVQVVVTFLDDSVDPPRPIRAVFRTAVYR